MTFRRLVGFISVVSLLLFSTSVTLSHEEGASFEQAVDGVRVDIGYDPELALVGEIVVYNFDIFDPETGEPIPWDYVWVRISKDEKTYLATGIAKADFGKSTLSYVYPEGGDYQLSVRFTRVVEEETINVEADFTLPVDELEEKTPMLGYTLAGIGGLIIGLSGGLLLRKKRE